jgi:hypothetical protein
MDGPKIVGHAITERDKARLVKMLMFQLARIIKDKDFTLKELILDEKDWSRDWPLIDMCVDSLRADLVTYLEAPLPK